MFEFAISVVISLIPLWFSQLKTLLGIGLINFRILFLKALKLPTFRMLWSRLLRRKGIVLKKLIRKVAEDIRVCKICKSSTTFWTSDGVEGALDLAHSKAFLLKYLLLHLWLLGVRFIGQILFSGESMNYKLFHI